MKKQYYFLSGLPRSGSTVLANIMMQNPDVYVSSTSGLPGLIRPLRDGWHKISAHRAMSESESLEMQRNVYQHVIDGYYAHVDRPIVIDKSRDWPNLIEILDWTLSAEQDVKIIATVRDVRQVIESFEELYIKTSATKIPGGLEGKNTMENRADYFASSDHTVGASYTALRDAVNRGWGDNIHFVRYSQLCSNPEFILSEIYEFLGEDNYKHNFMQIEQVTFEDDRIHTYSDLHKIETELKPAKVRNRLGAYGQKFENQSFWDG